MAFCVMSHTFYTFVHQFGMLTDPCGKGKKLYSMVSQDLSITHQSFCMEDLVLSFPLQFYSGAIFICSSSSSRGLWFTPYNNGWIQRQHLGDHPLRGSHKCFNSGHIIMNLTKFKVMPSMDAACHGPSPMARS
jgi:hypothetical protein